LSTRTPPGSASHPVKTGDVLTVALPGGVRVLKVLTAGERRGPAGEARLLYEDLSPPSPPGAAAGSAGSRPTKRDRRALDAFRADSETDKDFPADAD
jgi:ribosome-associated heat shock protein Hsp15